VIDGIAACEAIGTTKDPPIIAADATATIEYLCFKFSPVSFLVQRFPLRTRPVVADETSCQKY
jgi:hypothetical protein